MRPSVSAALLTLLLTAPAAAADPVTLTRPLAMGEAYRAAGSSNGAIYFNPAGISRLTMYSVEWSYLRLPDVDNTFQMSVVDTKTQAVGVGMGYALVPGDTSEHDGRLALSYTLARDRIFVGTAVRYLYLDRPEGTENESAMSVDGGLVISLGLGLHVGGVVHNLVRDEDHPATARRRFGGGIAYEGPLSIAADVVYDPAEQGEARYAYHTGAEVLVDDQIPVRGGWSFLPAQGDAHFVSVGFGFINRTGGLGLAYRQRVDVDGDRSFSISFRTFM